MAPRQGRRDALFRSLSPAQQQEAQQVFESGPPGPWATHAQGRMLGRRARGSLAGPVPEGNTGRATLPTGGSQGNAGVIRGAPTTGPRARGGRFGAQACFPSPSQEAAEDPRHGGTVSRVGPTFQNGTAIVYDRHIIAKTGTERQRAHPDSTGGQGLSPLADGPVRPAYYMLLRGMAPRYGNTSTRMLDNQGPFAETLDDRGRPQPLGIQDGSPWSRKYGGTPGLTYITGMRGTSGVVSPVAPGEPGDGPQLIRGGMPHGLHSHAQQNTALRTARRRATPSQRRTRRSLPANSARAGQSWSQNAQQLGGKAAAVPRTGGQLPGQAGRRLGRG